MSTRGTVGFRKNGEDKLMYVHCGSSPEELGERVVSFIKQTDVSEMESIYDKIVMIDENAKPTRRQIKECEKWTSLAVSDGSVKDWYCLLRRAQGNLFAFKEGLVYMLDGGDFIRNGRSCLYGYIINLDKKILEFWVGLPNRGQKGNRYGKREDLGCFPCRLVKTYPLSEFPEIPADFFVADMNITAGKEDGKEEED